MLSIIIYTIFKYTEMKNISFLPFLLFIASTMDCTTSDSSTKAIGDNAVVCLQFSYDGVAQNNTYMFKLTVDEFSSIKLKSIASILKQQSKVVASIQFQNQGAGKVKEIVISDANTASGIYRQILSFVINIENGTFTHFTLDNEDCSVCQHGDGTQACSSSTNNECFDKGTSYGGEDPKFFVSWIGTDKNGDHLLSHTKRLSRFSQYSVGSIYQSATGLITS